MDRHHWRDLLEASHWLLDQHVHELIIFLLIRGRNQMSIVHVAILWGGVQSLLVETTQGSCSLHIAWGKGMRGKQGYDMVSICCYPQKELPGICCFTQLTYVHKDRRRQDSFFR
jgi:hypothetical protein